MEKETVKPSGAPSSQVPALQETPSLPLPRPLPTALIVVGLGLLLAFLADMVALLPPQPQDVVWQVNVLERLFNEASIPMLALLAMLSGLWLSDALNGTKSRVFNAVLGGLALVFGLALLLAIPLYSNNVNRIYTFRKAEILNEKQLRKPEKGSELADQYDRALEELKANTFRNVFRFNANAGVVGVALVLLGVLGIRQTRKRPDVGFTCPTCKSGNVRLSQMNPTEKSLALVTRIHTFRCQDCGWRFRRWSLTGKPFTFLF